ncbi:MAG: CsbD family protein [Oscillospiraceae bacterium]|nr:CsbD family protein [Oscillospiraceae bacterium]
MGFDLGDIKEKVEKIEDKIPDEVIEKAKDLATKENLEKVKDKAEDLIDKFKK